MLSINFNQSIRHTHTIHSAEAYTVHSSTVCDATGSTRGAECSAYGLYPVQRTIIRTKPEIQKYQKTQRTHKHVTNQEHLQFIFTPSTYFRDRINISNVTYPDQTHDHAYDQVAAQDTKQLKLLLQFARSAPEI